MLHTLLCSFFTVLLLKTALFNEWKLLCNQAFSHLIQYCSGVTLIYFSTACIGRKRVLLWQKWIRVTAAPLQQWNSSSLLYSKEGIVSIQPPHFSFSPLSTLFSVFISIQFTVKQGKKKQQVIFWFSYPCIISWQLDLI